MVELDRNTVLSIIFFLAILGVAVAGYQSYEHYVLDSPGCTITDTFSCAKVTGTQYGEFPPNSPIATSAWGMAWWLVVLILSGSLLTGNRFFNQQELYLFGTTVFGVVFMLYLLTIEFYILPQQTGELAICPFCTLQHLLIITLLGLTYTLVSEPVQTYLPHVHR